jgi:GxxExxY protein
MEEDPLSYEIIGAALEVHREMGPGLYEKVYKRCMLIELASRGIPVEYEVPLPVAYKGYPIEDIWVDRKVILELKAASAISPDHEAQLLNYLRLTRCKPGHIFNFKVAHLRRGGIKRMVLTYLPFEFFVPFVVQNLS